MKINWKTIWNLMVAIRRLSISLRVYATGICMGLRGRLDFCAFDYAAMCVRGMLNPERLATFRVATLHIA